MHIPSSVVTCWDAEKSVYRSAHLVDDAWTQQSQRVGRMDDLGETRVALSSTDQEGGAWLVLLSVLVSDNQNPCPAEV